MRHLTRPVVARLLLGLLIVTLGLTLMPARNVTAHNLRCVAADSAS